MPERVLVVLAHPLADSFCAAAAGVAAGALARRNYDVDLVDLYREDFDPRLSAAERAAYHRPGYDTAAVGGYVARLRQADALVFAFPQWWFNMPAILKGFLDRVFVPGVAFDHAPDGGHLVPRLTHVRALWAVTSTG
jgi:putative NADPH-quinone reductase